MKGRDYIERNETGDGVILIGMDGKRGWSNGSKLVTAFFTYSMIKSNVVEQVLFGLILMSWILSIMTQWNRIERDALQRERKKTLRNRTTEKGKVYHTNRIYKITSEAKGNEQSQLNHKSEK